MAKYGLRVLTDMLADRNAAAQIRLALGNTLRGVEEKELRALLAKLRGDPPQR